MATRRLGDSVRWVSLVIAIVLVSGFWTETAEARLMATATDERLSLLPAPTRGPTTPSGRGPWPKP